jgi:hypothetical protein
MLPPFRNILKRVNQSQRNVGYSTLITDTVINFRLQIYLPKISNFFESQLKTRRHPRKH